MGTARIDIVDGVSAKTVASTSTRPCGLGDTGSKAFGRDVGPTGPNVGGCSDGR